MLVQSEPPAPSPSSSSSSSTRTAATNPRRVCACPLCPSFVRSLLLLLVRRSSRACGWRVTSRVLVLGLGRARRPRPRPRPRRGRAASSRCVEPSTKQIDPSASRWISFVFFFAVVWSSASRQSPSPLCAVVVVVVVVVAVVGVCRRACVRQNTRAHTRRHRRRRRPLAYARSPRATRTPPSTEW